MYPQVIKPFIDRFLALVLLVVFSPLWLLLSVLIYVTMGLPIFFRQERPGYKESIFSIYKFRTMTDEVDEEGKLLEDKQRLKGIGKLIRSTSMDELPQLLNVLRGDMSFVGPRPLLKEYLPLYSEKQKERHSIKPGITGWAQVNGRNSLTWEEKFKYDVWYVDNQSFWLDIKILWLTFLKIINRSDVSSNTSVTMEKFKGSK
jgi:undecaprenyl phosphate N,N'-diacetylbacillosamine 1-phosphate transferase